MKELKEYSVSRRSLWHTAEAIRRGHITIGFVGGSITEPLDSNHWADKVVDWFVARFPGVLVDVENAAKGATGSLSSILYVEDEILPRHCDLVFVESAVNDDEQVWGPCREGVLRKLLGSGESDIVVTYTYSQTMYEDFLEDRLTPSIADWEKLTEHYRVSSVFMSRYAFDLVEAGFLKWEEWLPDGLHPDHAGSRIYALPVCDLLEREIAGAEREDIPMAEPLYGDNWEKTYRFPLENVERIGAWRMVREYRVPTVDRILFTASPKAKLRFTFEGRGLELRYMSNQFHATYSLTVDGKEVRKGEPMPEWGKNAVNWVREAPPCLMEPGIHTAEIQPLFAPEGRGSSFELCDIAIIR